MLRYLWEAPLLCFLSCGSEALYYEKVPASISWSVTPDFFLELCHDGLGVLLRCVAFRCQFTPSTTGSSCCWCCCFASACLAEQARTPLWSINCFVPCGTGAIPKVRCSRPNGLEQKETWRRFGPTLCGVGVHPPRIGAPDRYCQSTTSYGALAASISSELSVLERVVKFECRQIDNVAVKLLYCLALPESLPTS